MRSVKFWRMAVKELSLTERMFFSDAIRTLFAWDVLREEYPELDIIMRILDSESRLSAPEGIPALKSTGVGTNDVTA